MKTLLDQAAGKSAVEDVADFKCKLRTLELELEKTDDKKEKLTLTRTESQHHIILLHCISCNRVTKHQTLTTHNTPLPDKYSGIGQEYKRRCLECGLEDERKF